MLVTGDTEFDAGELAVPVKVLRVGVGFDAVAADIEPHRGIKRSILADENVNQFIVEDSGLRDARLDLALATQTVIRNGLGLLGVSAPETM